MEFGAIFPTTEIGTDPVAIRDFAQAAEGLGYKRLLTYDHVVGAIHQGRDPPLVGPYTEQTAFHEPIALFGYLAALTQRIELSTGVLVLPQRQTVLVAKQAAELALLSGGRLRLAVGTGWNYVEYDALGVDFKTRGALLEEQIDVLRRLWSEPVVDFSGRFHRIDRAGINPLPPAPIPIWMGGASQVALERAARKGDGFLFLARKESPAQAAVLLELVSKQGRDPRAFGIEYNLAFDAGPKVWHEAAEVWSRLGARCISVSTMASRIPNDPLQRPPEPRQHIEALTTFMAEMKGYGAA
jgi:probable F420-dependent oxidoreductase